MVIDKSFFFPDTQITAQIAKELNWSGHPLGHPSLWPLSLKLTLNTVFSTKHALSLFWGDENYYFYNDACIPLMGEKKYLHSMGRPGAVVWEEAWDLVGPQIENVRKTGEASWKVDQYIPIHREGKISEAYFTSSYSPVVDEYGNTRGVLVISIENTDKVISEKKLAEKALIESRGDLYRVLMQAPSGVAFLKGPDLVYSLANSRYQEIFGKGEFLIGKPMRVALPDLAEESYRIFERVFDTGVPFSAKEFKSTVPGSRIDIYYSFAVQRINNSKGEAEGVIVIGDDVTEQVKDRMAREELNRHLQAIVQNMAEGLILTDQNGKMLIWNPAACRMHGFEKLENTDNEIHKYSELFQLYTIEGDVLELEDWPISRVLRGESFTGREVIVEQLDNSHRWIGSYNGSPIFNEHGNLIFTVLTIRDVTSRIDFELDLKKAINSRDEFLSIISHELKTPLTSLKLQNQSALRKIQKGNLGDLTAEKLSNLFDKNESQINRVTRLVDDMLDLTRIQSGKLSYNFEKCDLRDIVVDVYERFREQFENSDTELVNQCIDSVEGYFDHDRMEQVIVNLLTNALKYGEGKTVYIRLERINKTARLEVLDNGMGINPENFEIIFKKYERVVSADEVSGLGIGLFISKEIVEAHGGKIWVESALGMGARFIAELPVDSDNLKK